MSGVADKQRTRGFGAGVRHLRSEWGRWWRVEDLTEAHLAHRALNEQWRMWEGIRRRYAAEIRMNMKLLKQQQRQATNMQMQRMQLQRRQGAQGGGYRRGYGGGFGMFGGSGASPLISYNMMRWAQQQIKAGQEHFMPQPLNPAILASARDEVRTIRHRVAYILAVVLPAAWIGLCVLSVLTALAVTAATALWFTSLAFAKGRNPRRRRPPIPKLKFVPPAEIKGVELEEEVEEPFALAEAGRDPKQVREAVRLAFLKGKHARKVEIGEIHTPVETQYGWEVPLLLKSGSLEDFPPILKDLATPLRVGRGRIMAAPVSPDDVAEVKLRILTKDPFEHPLPIPVRPPGSGSIRNPFDLGLSIEGSTTPVVLAGQHAIVVADTGGGKTALIQRIADFVTSCYDAVIVDIDPVKRGLKVFSPLAALTARSPEEAELVLAQLIAEAKRRIASMPATQNMWEPTPDEPAIVVVLDEFIKLSPEAKEMAIELLRNLGREALISVVIITQDATKDVMGDAIADVPGLRIMLPCRTGDVPLVVGRQDAISLGWWPHLLVPSPDPEDPADAGKFYVIAPRHREPILRYASLLPPEEAARRVEERLKAPRPRLTLGGHRPAAAVKVPRQVRLLLDAFATHSDPEELTITELGDYLATIAPDVYGRWEGKDNRNTMISRTIKSELKAATGHSVSSIRRHERPGKPFVYRLDDIRGTLP
ncbi:type IV secretory system conjugative DNA transfer family protein [Streptomyces sp. NPDC013489]|uniref:type IV secretory system conjugative DNA transfer family protein n=1 Tax=Streptomyces sp. NPDC013489 TaxID=3155606 RepID=UPI0033F206DB